MEHALPGSMAFMDNAGIYSRLDKPGYLHRRINQADRGYVDGHVHTQTNEGVSAVVRSGIGAIYYSLFVKWLRSHLDDYAWRYNHGHTPQTGPGNVGYRLPRGCT
jgi:hypothetical protein